MHELLVQDNVNSEDLERLLKAREEGKADFLLIDVREDMEYDMGHVKGVDMLKPTSSFQQWAEQLFNDAKDKTVILQKIKQLSLLVVPVPEAVRFKMFSEVMVMKV
jgi:predicted sulfurtransferase